MYNQNLIYALIDPRTGHYRYIGLSTRGLARPRLHLKYPKSKDKTHRANWLRNLFSSGHVPIIKVIEYCNGKQDLSDAEKSWIDIFKNAGCPLTNHKDGGFSGGPDLVTRTRISNKLKGIKRSPETIALMREAKLGKKNPMFGKLVSTETRQKRSRSMRGEKNHRFGLVPPNGEATRFKKGMTPWNKGLKAKQEK